MKTLCEGLNDLVAATSMLKWKANWSLIPALVETLDTLGSLSFTFPGTANGRFELSWQNFR